MMNDQGLTSRELTIAAVVMSVSIAAMIVMIFAG
jgi:hypothetical protein